jgi:hypothetical protein
MAHRVCPWWLGYLLVNPLRRLVQNPVALLQPYVAEGMTVLEPGPGMGFFTLAASSRSSSSQKEFEGELAEAAEAGLHLSARPKVWRSHAAMLVKR